MSRAAGLCAGQSLPDAAGCILARFGFGVSRVYAFAGFDAAAPAVRVAHGWIHRDASFAIHRGRRMLDRVLVVLIDTNMLLFGSLILALLYAANEIGFRIGRWRARQRPAHERDLAGIGTITAGMLGLLAFTLGLTINIAQDRFEARRGLVVREANAIESAWLRAQLLTGDQGPAIAAQIEAFAKVELAYVSSDSFTVEPELIARASTLRTQIWQAMRTVSHNDPSLVTVPLTTALIDMFSAALAERFAFESRVPAHLSWMLMAGCLLAIGAMGYHLGTAGSRQMVLTSLLLVMWAGGLVLIADLNRPRIGSIRVDPAPLVWTIQNFEPAQGFQPTR
jgi:hypothetical protein